MLVVERGRELVGVRLVDIRRTQAQARVSPVDLTRPAPVPRRAYERGVRRGQNRGRFANSTRRRAGGTLHLQPHVTDFLDVVMYDRGLEFRLEEVVVPQGLRSRGKYSAR